MTPMAAPKAETRDLETRATVSDEPASLDEEGALLTAAWDVRGIDVETVQFLGGTAMSYDESGVRAVERIQRVRTLPALLEPGPEGTLAPFLLGDVLGEGGMGVVRSAEQTALERVVAVKGLHDDSDPVRAAPQLLREARITGSLEHPNVVPIYALGRDSADRPLIVMKRIEGTSWLEMLKEADEKTRLSDVYLRKNLGILHQVARTIHFAHSKGILHRDIKPDNVMIGAFDEVYVVDWGIAVRSKEGLLSGVPLASRVNAIEGTPAYLSPEMAAGDGEAIDARSDVYLLGATLHEIICGDPPHHGKTLMLLLTNAFASLPKEYGEDVPGELVTICHRAMSRISDDRYESAAAFADAIDEFLEHRNSTSLCDEAHKRLARLSSLFGDLDAGDTVDAFEQQVYMLFSEARFAFSQALRGWHDNKAALAGRRQLLLLMIGFELARDRPGAAAALLREVDDPPNDISKKVKSALQKQHESSARLEVLERDADIGFGERVRHILTYIISLCWGLSVVLCGFLTRHQWLDVDHWGFALVNAAFMLGAIAAAATTRGTMMANATNRRITYTTMTVFGGSALLWPALGAVGVSLPHSTLIGALVTGLVWLTAAFGISRVHVPMVIGKASAVVGIALWPAYHYEIFGITGLLAAFATASVQLRSSRPAADSTSD
jgi:serine/threonine protein kinase